MSNQVIWPGKAGTISGVLTRLTQASNLETVRIDAKYADYTSIDLTGYTLTGTLRMKNTHIVTAITGALVAGDGFFDWTPTAEDLATAGWFGMQVVYSDGSKFWASLEVDVIIEPLHGVSYVPNPPNVGVPPGDAAWLSSAIDTVPNPSELGSGVAILGTAIVRSDGGIGGDARGANAVDLQRSRGSDSDVASGVEATVSGGSDNVASGSVATVSGGLSNTAANLGATVSGGLSNTADGDFATVSGGSDNVAGGVNSFVSGRNMQLSAVADRSHVHGYSATAVSFAQPDAFITYALRPFLSAPNTAVADGDMKDGSISFWIDEINDDLVFRVKYSDGTLKTGTMPLV